MERMMNVAILLQLQRAEEVLVELAPVAHAQIAALYGIFHGPAQLGGALGLGHLHLDGADAVAERKEVLRRLDRHVRVGRVVFVHAAVEDGGDAELARARQDAHGTEIAERRHERDLVAHVHVQRLGELAPDRETGVHGGTSDGVLDGGVDVGAAEGEIGALQIRLAAGAEPDHFVGRKARQLFGVFEVVELADLDVVDQLDHVADRSRVDAAHEHAGRGGGRRGHRFAAHDRRRGGNAGDEPHAVRALRPSR